ncbi:cytochrome P450 [Pseudolysinimonas sp.]|uniref:cytochrome P450 n=1 Tax=Pseudolysinimonas sp. TaxID=2680009 RepID=UPI003782E508
MTLPIAPPSLPLSDEDPFSAELLDEPAPFHERLRDAGEVVFLERYGVYAMGRYATVHAALTDWQQFISSAGVGVSNFRKEQPWRPPSLLLEADPPAHNAPRASLAKILSPRSLRAYVPIWEAAAERHVEELLADAVDGVLEIDAVPTITEAFPLRVFPDAVGLERDGREHLLPYGDFVFNAFGPHNFLVEAGSVGVSEHAAWIARQCERDRLDPTGIGASVWAAADRGDITEQQAPLIIRSILTAGVDTTIHALSAVLHAVANAPNQWAALRAEPSLARRAFDEAIRLESPVQTFFRTANGDVRIGGTVVPDGQKILMFLGSANRDPRHWDHPDDFDLGRDPSGHVGFGMGIHQCVGQHVARLEATALLKALAARVRAIEPAGPIRRHLNNTLHATASLPLRLALA